MAAQPQRPQTRLALRAPLPLAPLLLLLLLAVAAPTALACTSVMVSGGATSDGSVLIARNDDGEGAFTSNVLLHHPQRHDPAVFRSNSNRLQLELPGGGLSYTAWPVLPPDEACGRNASGESDGANSAGVSVSATETIYNAERALAADPYVKDAGVTEDAIPSLLLPMADTARRGIVVLGGLVESIGAGEGFGVLVADADEAWYFETASGHQWLARRVPDDSFFVIANQGRFREVDLSDTETTLASPGLLDFAQSLGVYDPSSGQPLDYFKAFMVDAPAHTEYNVPRLCAAHQLFTSSGEAAAAAAALDVGSGGAGGAGDATGSGGAGGVCCSCRRGLDWEKMGEEGGEMTPPPVFGQPSRPLDVLDVAASLRIYYEGTPADPYTSANPNVTRRPVAVLRTQHGHITRMRKTASTTTNASAADDDISGGSVGSGSGDEVGSTPLPDALGVINYVALGMPLLSPFVPLYIRGLPGGNGDLPRELTHVNGRPDPHSLFWKARRLQALVFQDFSSLAPTAMAAISDFERAVEYGDRPAMESAYVDAALVQGDARSADEVLVKFTHDVLRRAVELLERLAEEAATALGLQGVPSDKRMLQMLGAAEKKYEFLPVEQSNGAMAAVAAHVEQVTAAR